MAARVTRPSLRVKSELRKLCEDSLAFIVLDPAVRILGVTVAEFESPRFGSAEAKPYYIVSIETNDASILRGAARSLKGSYKERIEGLLDIHVKQVNPSASVYVEIRGPESNSVERLVPLRDMLRAGRLSKSSPIVRIAEQYDIGYIQIRGRHLIAPSPAIAEFLARRTDEHLGKWRTVVDLFAGTAITTKVLCRLAKPDRIFVVDNDPVKLNNAEIHVRDPRAIFLLEDAMTYKFPPKTDLVVADPYYEDVEKFLRLQLRNMAENVGSLLLVPGNVENELWNARMSRLVSDAGYVVAEHSLYGQVIIYATKA
jgi:hypothetical protein